MMSLAITIGLSSLSGNIPETDWAAHAYGEEIEFVITRNNRKVGKHTVKFEKDGTNRIVTSETSIKIKFLFFTAYRFQYTSKETWSDHGLHLVESTTVDGGDEVFHRQEFNGHEYQFSTNHWNPGVLHEDIVYNTITGKTNSISITPAISEMIETGSGLRKAHRYDYDGDLKDVSAWYDDNGRWVGLRFTARDGSTIKYLCERCGI